MLPLKDKVIFITGASRGIGREIALLCARKGAHIVIAAKTAEAHAKLPGTIYAVAAEIEELGAQALPLVVDVRHEQAIEAAVAQTIQRFGGIDVLVNNASAINLSDTLNTPAKRFDLMFSVNVRATFLVSRLCLPHLLKAKNPHIINLSPPLNLDPQWFKHHGAYTMSKYGMSLCTLGMAEEFKEAGVAVNSLWPKTTIATSAIKVHFPPEVFEGSRWPAIVAEAAYVIMQRENCTLTGQFLIDEDLLRSTGISDFSEYAVNPEASLFPDLFI